MAAIRSPSRAAARLRLRHAAAHVRAIPRPLAALLVAGALLSVAWGLAVAPLQGFDESDHVAYASRLAASGAPPKVSEGTHPYSDIQNYVWFGPLDYLDVVANPPAKPPWSDAAQQQFERIERGAGPDAQGNGEGPNPLAKNPPLYYAYEGVASKLTPGGDFFDRLSVMRLASTLLFLATITFAWLLGGELFRRTLPRVVLAGVVALQPMAEYLGSVVNTDGMLMMVWTAFLWLALRTYRLGLTPQRAAVLAAVAGASILTHGRGLAIVPVFLVALGATLLRHRPAARRALVPAAVGLGVLGAVVIAYRLYASAAGGGSLYGGEASFTPAAKFNLHQFASFVWQFYLPRLSSMTPRLGPDYGFRQVYIESGWGSFGSYEIVFPFWLFDLIQVVVVASFFVVVGIAIRRAELLRERAGQVAILLAAGVSMVLLLHLASYRALLGGGNDPLITGRYLLPLVALYGTGAAVIVASVPRRVGPYVAVAVLGSMSVLALSGLGLTLARFYA